MKLTFIRLVAEQRLPLPYYVDRVAAGFPSPASGYVDASIDLNDLCITHPHATFLIRVSGCSMTGAGIEPNDLLVVDRSLQAKHGDIIVCSLQGEFTVKQLCCKPKPKLIAHHPDYPDIPLSQDLDFTVFGVVTNVIRQIKRGRLSASV